GYWDPLVPPRPGARVEQAAPGAQRLERADLQPAAVVAHLHPEPLALLAGGDLHVVAAVAAGDAVLDGVLHDRLQDHPRHLAVERVGIDLHVDGKTILEARLFDVEILLEKIDLFLQRDLGLAAAIERDAEQIAEPADHAIGALRVAVDQRGDWVQGARGERG